MNAFEVKGQRYQSSQMSAMVQLHVARRLAPVFSALGEAFQKNAGDFKAALPVVSAAISALSDSDVEYVINACLRVTQRSQGEGLPWANLTASNGIIMFPDIDMQQMLQIAGNVLTENFAPFFSALPAGS